MTIPGTVEKTTSAMGRSNSNSNAKSPTKAVQIKKPGITAVKRKQSNNPVVASKSPTANPAKKNKKSSSSSINSSGNNNKTFKSTAVASPVALFDLEVTICPICDEACTCPKTATIPVVKSPVSKKTSNEILNSKKPKLINKKKNRSSSGKGNSNNKKETAKNVKKYEISSEDSEEYYEEEEESEGESTGNSTALVEDPALSFIRMIYSDEESLDEEEAYALYQATQLFSSSSDEGEEEESFEESYGEDEEEEVEESGDEFEYTVVEYVQPTKKQIKKSTEFVAYESGDESELKDNEIREQGNLLLNAESNSDLGGESSADDDEDDEGDDEENWLTYSVFDIDRDLALNQSTGSSSAFTSLSSHGSGTTPDTLLFSTSSTDKIPNIAPQVLAAISAAAKHMANQRSESTNGTSKYFSYITLRDPFKNEEVNEEEFLFFEEPEPEPEQESIDEQSDSVNSADSDVRSDDEIISIGEFESLSEDFSSNESVTEIILPSSTSKKIIKTPINIQTTPASITTTTNEYINRWNRVPIGAFRRSRRPSIPAFNYIHPSMALKTFSTDPTNFTGANSTTGGEDSFDESSITPMERSYSVITLDELDLDLDITESSTTNPCTSNALCPLPKRSRSVMASSNSLVNNFEWLNNNWNWEI